MWATQFAIAIVNKAVTLLFPVCLMVYILSRAAAHRESNTAAQSLVKLWTEGISVESV